jgi:hypothetical protein
MNQTTSTENFDTVSQGGLRDLGGDDQNRNRKRKWGLRLASDRGQEFLSQEGAVLELPLGCHNAQRLLSFT